MHGRDTSLSWVKQGRRPEALFRTRYHNATLTLGRLRQEEEGEVVLQSFRHDAHLAIMHVGPAPRNHISTGPGRMAEVFHAADAFNLTDLNAAPSCRIIGRFDSLHLHIPRAALDDLADEAEVPLIRALRTPDGWNTQDPIVDGLRPLMLAALERPEEASQLLIDHLVLGLCAHLVQRYGGMPEPGRLRGGGLAPWQLRLARELIAENIAEAPSLAEIARQCRLSVAHFSRAFKASTGTTPHGYLQACRVARARQMLARPELTLAEIALACGFADQSHFTRVFARQEGETPGLWRRQQRRAA
ncbi:helix-turn-helix domain-containing protein [Falsiroseomonas sp.]|uniref:helix-turn-helix domain-containing protein n=1 Tax=Falsiroseomonas sp. TaxID=2870721 RepID=UPI003F708A63